jgi:hypothetical protein
MHWYDSKVFIQVMIAAYLPVSLKDTRYINFILDILSSYHWKLHVIRMYILYVTLMFTWYSYNWQKEKCYKKTKGICLTEDNGRRNHEMVTIIMRGRYAIRSLPSFCGICGNKVIHQSLHILLALWTKMYTLIIVEYYWW